MLALFQTKCVRDRLRYPRDILRCLGDILRCLRAILAFVQTNCLANVLGCLRGILCFSFFFLVASTTYFQWKQTFHQFWKCTKPAKRLINMLRCKRNRKMSEMSPISACFQTQYEETSFQTPKTTCRSGRTHLQEWSIHHQVVMR